MFGFGGVQEIPETRIRQIVAESEQRMVEAVRDLRKDVADINTRFIPAQQAQERFTADEQRIKALEDNWQQINRILPTLARSDNIAEIVAKALAEYDRTHMNTVQVNDAIDQAIEEHAKNCVTPEGVKTAIRDHLRLQWDNWRTWVLVAISVLGFLSGAGIIHPAAFLFGH